MSDCGKNRFESLAHKIKDAVQRIEYEDASGRAALRATVAELDRALETPAQAILRQRFHTVENLCIIAAEEMGLLQFLSPAGGEGNEAVDRDAAELAAATGYDQTMIVRIMRVITAIGFADEVGHQRYRANAITSVQSTPGAHGGFFITNDFLFGVASQVREYFRQLKPCRLEETMPAYDFASSESIWETLRKKADWKANFDNAMQSRQKLFSTPWHVKFPLQDYLASQTSTDKPIIVDIGGNQGVDLQRLVDVYPQTQCRLILQDLPETIKGIPPGSLSPRIEQTSYDFFTPQPIAGASIYYMKSVLHDWDDAASQKILSNTAAVMDGNSRLLINDIVLADTHEVIDRADMDVLMLFISNGIERSRTQWAGLLASVSPPLDIAKIWTLPEDPQSIIEARLARVP